MYRETVSLSIDPESVTMPLVVPILNKLEAKTIIYSIKICTMTLCTYD